MSSIIVHACPKRSAQRNPIENVAHMDCIESRLTIIPTNLPAALPSVCFAQKQSLEWRYFEHSDSLLTAKSGPSQVTSLDQ